jgi:uncharacterized phage infection (PIP) family protein YhgE
MEKLRIVATLQLLVAALLLCSCSTTYHAPDAKKLNASATKLKKAIVKSHETAKKAKDKHAEVEQAANQTFIDQQVIEEKFNEFSKRLPPELQSEGKEIQDKIEEQRKHNVELQTKVEEERILHEQLAKDNTEVTTAKTDWDQESSNYQKDAAAVAAQATEDNKKLSSQLWKQKLLSFFGITGAIVFVVCLVGGFILWKLGKLAIKL